MWIYFIIHILGQVAVSVDFFQLTATQGTEPLRKKRTCPILLKLREKRAPSAKQVLVRDVLLVLKPDLHRNHGFTVRRCSRSLR
jgi:hypothetical protein